MDELLAALVCIAFALIGWSIRYAYLFGRLLADLQAVQRSHGKRITRLERHTACRSSTATT